jgi:dihydrofolate reductase
MRILAINHISLDGVIQSPARPAEDTRGGFTHGGWASEIEDPDMGQAMGARITADSGWLFGRVSYEGMLEYWNGAGGPFKDALNGKQKYVATSDAGNEPRWPNTHVVSGDVPTAVESLRADGDGLLVVMGSGTLLQTLIPRGLVDELLLFVHPVALGSGIRMFGPSDAETRFELTEHARTPGGVSIVGYRRRT